MGFSVTTMKMWMLLMMLPLEVYDQPGTVTTEFLHVDFASKRLFPLTKGGSTARSTAYSWLLKILQLGVDR